MGGSFVSKKRDPADIDCVNLIDFDPEHDLNRLMPFLLIGGSVDTFGVDGHLIAVYPKADERYMLITQPSQDYWFSFLSHDRDNNPRGILQLNHD